MTTIDADNPRHSQSSRNTVCMHYVRAACQRAVDTGLNLEDCLSYTELQPICYQNYKQEYPSTPRKLYLLKTKPPQGTQPTISLPHRIQQ